MRIRSLAWFTAASSLALIIAACQGPPPTQYVIVLTAEPIIVTATPEETTPETQATATTETVAAQTTTQPAGGQQRPTRTPDAFPTPTVSQIQVAEQSFQNGVMFWLEPIGQIWVIVHGEDDTSGVWSVYDDEFEEGDVEFDPAIVAPEGLLQPERGFGLLWRSHDEIRDALGWALQPEVGFVSSYEYQPVGEVVNGAFVADPGYHILSSAYGNIYRFNEINGTWQLLQPSRVGRRN
jgi:hypothetical protein